MKKAQAYLLLSLFFIASVSKAQNNDQLRSLFAIGKWQEVLDLAPVDGPGDVQVMRLESMLQLGDFARAQEIARVIIPQLQEKQREIILLHLMRGAEQSDDVSAFFTYDQLRSERNKTKTTEVAYWRGRMHLLAGRFDLAESELLQVPLYSPYGIRAQYLIATSELMKGEREFAVNRFAKLKSVKAMDVADVKIIRIATLSQAKLLYQMGKYDEALRAFGDTVLDPSSQLELAWTAMKFGDELLGKEPALAAVQYDSAFRVATKIPKDAFLENEEEMRKQLLDAELKLRRGEASASVSAFEAVMKNADELANSAPKNSWLSSQPEILALDNQIAEAEHAKDELGLLVARAESRNLLQESADLKQTLIKLESLRTQLAADRTEMISNLQARWKSHLARFSDSARVGLFSNRFRVNARIEQQIEALQVKKAAALNRLDVAFEATEAGAPK